MAHYRNEKLTSAAVRIGTVMGKADRRARQAANSARKIREQLHDELQEMTKAADRLARDLRKARKRLEHALR